MTSIEENKVDESTVTARTDVEGQDYVTFYLGDEPFAFSLDSVREIIHVPPCVAVPLTPKALVGLANLRGRVLPVLDLRRMLDVPPAAVTDASRVIVTDCGTTVGLVVDRVERVIRASDDDIDSAAGGNDTVSMDYLAGVIRNAAGYSLVQLIDVRRVVDAEFTALARVAQDVVSGPSSSTGDQGGAVVEEERVQLVTFQLGSEEYALEIDRVQEIVRIPEDVTALPKSDAHVLGLMSLRERLLGLVKLRRIFAMEDDTIGDRHRVIVTRVGAGESDVVGFVVDEVREVMSVEANTLAPLPRVLAAHGANREVSSVCRLEDGARLVSVLAAPALLITDSVQDAIAAATGDMETVGQGDEMNEDLRQDTNEELQLVVFRLGEQDYGAPIHAVSEIIRVSDEMAAVPKTPAYVEGIVNLRGKVLPVIDLRVRFDLKRSEVTGRERILVMTVGGHQTGFIVDAVAEVLRVPARAIERSPRMSDTQARVMGTVANLKESKRMILVVSPDELLDSSEIQEIDAVRAA